MLKLSKLLIVIFIYILENITSYRNRNSKVSLNDISMVVLYVFIFLCSQHSTFLRKVVTQQKIFISGFRTDIVTKVSICVLEYINNTENTY